jgi:hypothetical protein
MILLFFGHLKCGLSQIVLNLVNIRLDGLIIADERDELIETVLFSEAWINQSAHLVSLANARLLQNHHLPIYFRETRFS